MSAEETQFEKELQPIKDWIEKTISGIYPRPDIDVNLSAALIMQYAQSQKPTTRIEGISLDDAYKAHQRKQLPIDEERQELFEEAKTLMERLLPSKEYGEDADCDALYYIIEKLATSQPHWVSVEDVRRSAKLLIDYHLAEQEGISSGQPTPQEWMKAVDDLYNAISALPEPPKE